MNIYHAPLGAELPRLSAEDEAKPFSEFYYAGPGKPDGLMLAALENGPMAPENALLPENLGALIRREESPDDIGYCVLPSGVGYSSIKTVMRRFTMEMSDWYDVWREADDPLRYSLWFPGSHIIEEKGWIQEDLGFGLVNIYMMNPLSPEAFRLDPDICTAENGFFRLFGCNAFVHRQNAAPGEKPFNMALMHYVRKAPDGLEWHTRFWLGAIVAGGKLVNMLRFGQSIPPEYARLVCEHSAVEMATKEQNFPALYARLGK